jgi:ribonuclease HII
MHSNSQKAAKLKNAKYRENFKRLLLFDAQHRANISSNNSMPQLIGTDEVGRGCLAGPVVAAAVILPEIKLGTRLAKALVELNDSKKLSFSKRANLASTLQESCLWAIGEATPAEINEINILHASLLAMKRAIDLLSTKTILEKNSALVLVDGNQRIKDFDYAQATIIDGDAKSASIAAASIIAKVYRDRFMMQLSDSFPGFDWHQNKGYGSLSHRTALRNFGMTQWHRRVFCEKIMVEQLTIDLS